MWASPNLSSGPDGVVCQAHPTTPQRHSLFSATDWRRNRQPLLLVHKSGSDRPTPLAKEQCASTVGALQANARTQLPENAERWPSGSASASASALQGAQLIPWSTGPCTAKRDRDMRQ